MTDATGIDNGTPPAAPEGTPTLGAGTPNAGAAEAGQTSAGTPSTPSAEDWAKAQETIQRLEREKTDARVRKEGELKQNAKRDQLLNLAKALQVEGIDDKAETVESLTQKLTGRVAQGDSNAQAVEDARQARIELAVLRSAVTAGANADKLTNLRSFERATRDLDPTAPDFATKVEAAIAAEVAKDPTLAIREGANTSGAEHHGGSGGGSTTVTAEEFAKMTMLEKNRLFMTNPDEFKRLTA